jgi:DNA adenine methylase
MGKARHHDFEPQKPPCECPRCASAMLKARADFEQAYEHADDPVERARRTVVKAFMGFGSTAIFDPRPAGMRTSSSLWRPPTAFRAASQRSGTTPAHDWSTYPDQVAGFCERLRGVVIEHRPALEVIQQHDRVETLHYVDPPYLHSTRTGIAGRNPKSQHRYRHEMSDEEHVELAGHLHQVQGMVVLSGYHSPMYDELYQGWERHERPALADKAKPRLEVVWLNPACVEARRRAQDQGVLAFTPAKGPASDEKLLQPKGAKRVSRK